MLRSFLARFTLVTFFAAVVTAVGLAYVLDREQQKVLENNLTTTSVGQTSALLAALESRSAYEKPQRHL
ncbi:MAG: hypothetical protein GIW97_02230 [Candidatus Eremiobacteraeota bacterium]|nr:hypothetical protein [Candidatus Eremiobacteraeota bacterium]